MTPQEAADLAARTLVAIDERAGLPDLYPGVAEELSAGRERVASDLAGIEEHRLIEVANVRYPDARPLCTHCKRAACTDAARYTAGLVRTARLYGVTP